MLRKNSLKIHWISLTYRIFISCFDPSSTTSVRTFIYDISFYWKSFLSTESHHIEELLSITFIVVCRVDENVKKWQRGKFIQFTRCYDEEIKFFSHSLLCCIHYQWARKAGQCLFWLLQVIYEQKASISQFDLLNLLNSWWTSIQHMMKLLPLTLDIVVNEWKSICHMSSSLENNIKIDNTMALSFNHKKIKYLYSLSSEENVARRIEWFWWWYWEFPMDVS